jgi:hypothetical protein
LGSITLTVRSFQAEIDSAHAGSPVNLIGGGDLRGGKFMGKEIAAALLGALAVLGCAPSQAAAQGNGLIGSWRLDPGSSCPITERVFGPTSASTHTRAIGPYPAEDSTNPVTYNTEDPSAVYVIGPTGIPNAGKWKIIDRDHIQDISFTGCVYDRTE